MLYDILISYLRILSRPRYQSHNLVPDGSDVLDCLAYGFSKLVEEIKAGDDIYLTNATLMLLDDLDARLSQVAYSSKHWVSSQEWESVEMFAWKVIESMGLNRSEESKGSKYPDRAAQQLIQPEREQRDFHAQDLNVFGAVCAPG